MVQDIFLKREEDSQGKLTGAVSLSVGVFIFKIGATQTAVLTPMSNFKCEGIENLHKLDS